MKRSPLASSFVLAPSIEPRTDGRAVDMLVMHYTGMETAARACDWLCNPVSRVSCHYLVDEAGRITQMVCEDMRAWHAGQSQWRGETDTNSRSIGIEIHNPGHTLGYPDFPAAQMEAVIALSHDILSRHAIPPRNVVAHSDVAPLRKVDPGEKFDWAMLAKVGIGHYVPPAASSGGQFFQQGDRGQPVEALQAMLALYGYGLEINGTYDALTRAVVRAFQLHYRQARVDGTADRATIDTLHALLGAL
jgi:N-acetylmuramoyl-L-alanine amidase